MKKIIYAFIAVILITAFMFVPISQFPTTSGLYGVGQRAFHWVDKNRKESYVDDPEHPYREIMAYVFYPAQKNKNATRVRQDPRVIENIKTYFSQLTGLPKFLFTSLRYAATNATPDAQVASSERKFPVIVFSPGSPALPRSYSWLLEEIASHGFVVVGINHTYVTSETFFPDGKTASWVYPKVKKRLRKMVLAGRLSEQDYARWVTEWGLKNFYTTYVEDIRFAVAKIQELADQGSEFWSAVNPDKIGVLGQSFGGSAVVRACRVDDRIKCGINMDGSIRSEDAQVMFEKPFLFLIGEKSHLWDPDHPRYPFKRKGTAISIIEKEKLNPQEVKTTWHKEDQNMEIVTVPGIGHSAFGNISLLLNTTLLTRVLSHYYYFALEASSSQASEILVNQVAPQVVTFFDTNLN